MKHIDIPPPKSLPVSVRLTEDLNNDIDVIAKANDRPKSWVIEQAIKDYVAVQQWQLLAIQEGIRAADAGKTVPHDAVEAWVQSWGQHDELPKPE